ncbi:MAG: hypothetical protein MJE68_16235 [Proteobacteria bacterium]|nr:hypothetical protein [Pseudomonadota bacterium]
MLDTTSPPLSNHSRKTLANVGGSEGGREGGRRGWVVKRERERMAVVYYMYIILCTCRMKHKR